MKHKRMLPVLSLVLCAALLLSACAAPAAAVVTTPAATLAQSATPAAMPSPAETTAGATPAETPSVPAETTIPTAPAETTPAVSAAPQLIGPDIIGLYQRGSGGYNLLTKIDKKWIKGKDICDIYSIASNDEKLAGSSFENLFRTHWNSFADAGQFHIGYRVIFTLKSQETVTLNIRSPKDAPKDPKKYFYQYVEVYMYDSLKPKNGPKRMHLVENAMRDDTIITSIKLTSGSKIAEVESIRLSVFVYHDDEDFDPESGEYIGGTMYEIPISNGPK